MSEKPRQVNEPALPQLPAPVVVNVTEPAVQPGQRVKAYDKNTGKPLPDTVPIEWLDGRFPNLTATPRKDGA